MQTNDSAPRGRGLRKKLSQEQKDTIAKTLKSVFDRIKQENYVTGNVRGAGGQRCKNDKEIRESLVKRMAALPPLPGVQSTDKLRHESLRKMIEDAMGLGEARVTALLRLSPYWNSDGFESLIAPLYASMGCEYLIADVRPHIASVDAGGDAEPPPSPTSTPSLASSSDPRGSERQHDSGIEQVKTWPADRKVLLLTAEGNETKALVACFSPDGEAPTLEGRQTYRDLGQHGRYRVISVVISRQGGGAAQSTVQQAIDELGFGIVVVVGTAFGVDKREQQLGDVLVSDSVQCYELGDLTPNGSFVARGANDRVHHNLLQMFKDRQHHGKPSAFAGNWPDIRFGLMLSGDKLVEDRNYREQLKRQWPTAVGGELAAAGVLEAVQAARSSPQWIVVKGISDWADGIRIEDDDLDTRQLHAAWNASLLVKTVLHPKAEAQTYVLPAWMVKSNAAASRPVFRPHQIFRDRFLHSSARSPELIVVPEGEFLMGAASTDPQRRPDECPPIRISFAEPFALGRYPVTFDEYDLFCQEVGRARPADNGWGRGTRPVINVSWDDAVAYAEWLTQCTGHSYRLPSEAAWEYACRAGSLTPFTGGRSFLTEKDANFLVERLGGIRAQLSRGRTSPVDTFAANAWGFHDMHGNVAEWMLDCWHDSVAARPSNGTAWTTGPVERLRVQRGGCWDDPMERLRCAARSSELAAARRNTYGFRVCRVL